MARGTISKKAKQPKIKLGKRAAAALDREKYGDEPTFDTNIPLTSSQRADFYTWHNILSEYSDAKDYLLEYLEDMGRPELEIVRRIDERTVFGYGSTACWIARLIMQGYQLGSSEEEHLAVVGYMNELIEKIIAADRRERDEAAHAKNQKGRTDYQLLSDKAVDIVDVIVTAIDPWSRGTHDPDFDVYGLLKSKRVPDYTATKLIELLEMEELPMFDPPEEGERELKNRLEKRAFLMRIISDIRDYAEDHYVHRPKKEARAPKVDPKTGEPVQRKPRKKKPISIEKRISRMIFQQEHHDYDIVSIKPEKVIGARELWVFNTRYDILQVYRAADPNVGLDVKGTTLQGYDEVTSMSKRCGRHAVRYIEIVKGGGKVALRDLMDEIKSVKIKVNGRLGENSVLLRALT